MLSISYTKFHITNPQLMKSDRSCSFPAHPTQLHDHRFDPVTPQEEESKAKLEISPLLIFATAALNLQDLYKMLNAWNHDMSDISYRAHHQSKEELVAGRLATWAPPAHLLDGVPGAHDVTAPRALLDTRYWKGMPSAWKTFQITKKWCSSWFSPYIKLMEYQWIFVWCCFNNMGKLVRRYHVPSNHSCQKGPSSRHGMPSP